ncbi:hypothetical protein F3D69_18430 [Bacteroides ovatus]|uniref:Response regulator n=1 Tax=Bacteroides ovatus TaxID=28116 RepID=A0A5M5ECL2_BACOV|nr:hypothetical protein F3D64_17925 [Bacteroides ovatus]KAA4006430.1 hypothetical protein F3F37_17770 [Bacteroides ovatus]KAA4016519.1 hypothetical protein F3D53_20835 [Bacteroides ovatus]KAA4028992.1 hypothetical protein F3D52_13785 [Bacteroides ovatus]KAA4030990.1 hypothetical protein F3D60_12775 [Bacteroides ovatus]
MSKKYRIGYLDEDEGYQAKFYQAFKNEFDIKILPIENINNVYDVLRFINDEELDALVVDYRLADSGQLTFNGDSVVDLINSQKKYFPLVMLTSYAQDAIAHMEDVYIVKDKEEIESSANLFLKQLETAIDRYQTKIITAENKIKELSEKKVLSIQEEELLRLHIFMNEVDPEANQLPASLLTSSAINNISDLVKESKELLSILKKNKE